MVLFESSQNFSRVNLAGRSKSLSYFLCTCLCFFLSVYQSVPGDILSLTIPVSLSLLLPAMNGHLPSSTLSHFMQATQV